MKIIDTLITRTAKIMGGDRRTARMQELIMKAYEAGRQDAIKDVMITLTDDMINDDHAAALELINANY